MISDSSVLYFLCHPVFADEAATICRVIGRATLMIIACDVLAESRTSALQEIDIV